jgi:hypothetical protein
MDGTPNLDPRHSLIGGAENIKLLFDELLDSRRETEARARAWEAIALDMAQTSARRAQNAATIDPVARGTGDAVTAAAYTPNRSVDVAAVPILAAAIGEAIAAALKAARECVTKPLPCGHPAPGCMA